MSRRSHILIPRRRGFIIFLRTLSVRTADARNLEDARDLTRVTDMGAARGTRRP